MGIEPKKRIAVLFPAFNGGGGEAVAVWILQALHAHYDVTLISLTNQQLGSLDRMYGTRLVSAGIKLACPGPHFLAAALRFTFFHIAELPLLRQHMLMRQGRRLSERFDLLFSGSNEMEFGEPGLQYMHDPPRWATGSRCVQALTGYSEKRMGRNLSLVPSAWLSDHYQRAYGICPRVIPPPSRTEFPRQSWASRDGEFLCVARIAPAKRIEDAIEILRRVRALGHAVRMRIVTAGGKWLHEKKIQLLVRRHSSWVCVERNVSNDRYLRLLGSRRYGINAAPHEGFGISIAEMINAGCIPFIRGKGGQSEILEDCSEIHFNDLDEGVCRIVNILNTEALQKRILSSLSLQQGRFSRERFMKEIRNVVKEQLAARQNSREVQRKTRGYFQPNLN